MCNEIGNHIWYYCHISHSQESMSSDQGKHFNLLCYFFHRKYKYIHFTSFLHTNSWNPSSCKTRTYLFYRVNIRGVDVLASGDTRNQGISNHDTDNAVQIKIIPSPNVNFNWPISQILECTCSISQNAPFRTEMCTFLFWMTHSGIWNRCILGFVRLVYCMPSSMTRHTGHTWVTGSPLEQPSSEWDMPSDSHCWGYTIQSCSQMFATLFNSLRPNDTYMRQ